MISAWHFSAAINCVGELFVWGTGIFGEFLKPNLMNFKNSTNKFKSIMVGGSFSVIVD